MHKINLSCFSVSNWVTKNRFLLCTIQLLPGIISLFRWHILYLTQKYWMTNPIWSGSYPCLFMSFNSFILVEIIILLTYYYIGCISSWTRYLTNLPGFGWVWKFKQNQKVIMIPNSTSSSPEFFKLRVLLKLTYRLCQSLLQRKHFQSGKTFLLKRYPPTR